MILQYFKNLLASNKAFFLKEAYAAKGFTELFFKQRNTGKKWTREEKKLIKQYLKTMALAIPALIIFLPPGGKFLLPVLVDIMDRRKNQRRPQESVAQIK
jgi:hypothetical protein